MLRFEIFLSFTEEIYFAQATVTGAALEDSDLVATQIQQDPACPALVENQGQIVEVALKLSKISGDMTMADTHTE